MIQFDNLSETLFIPLYGENKTFHYLHHVGHPPDPVRYSGIYVDRGVAHDRRSLHDDHHPHHGGVYDEVYPLSDAGHVYTIVLIVTGVGFFLYVIGAVIQFMVEGRVRIIMGRKRLDRKISQPGIILRDSGIRQKYNLIIIAIKKPDDRMIFNPSFETHLDVGDAVIAVGDPANLRKLQEELNSKV